MAPVLRYTESVHVSSRMQADKESTRHSVVRMLCQNLRPEDKNCGTKRSALNAAAHNNPLIKKGFLVCHLELLGYIDCTPCELGIHKYLDVADGSGQLYSNHQQDRLSKEGKMLGLQSDYRSSQTRLSPDFFDMQYLAFKVGIRGTRHHRLGEKAITTWEKVRQLEKDVEWL